MRLKGSSRAEIEQRQSPFDLLLAASGSLQSLHNDVGLVPARRARKTLSSPSPPSKQSDCSQDGETLQRLRQGPAEPATSEAASATQPGRRLVVQLPAGPHRDAQPEGVGTSGAGGSGNTADSSSTSRQDQDDEFPREESSEIHEGKRWGTRSPRRRKRQRMMWTAELHERFLNAVNHLGMKNAVPKTILRMMNVEGMTRENVASHLQKYRLHLKQRANQSGSALCAAEQQTGLSVQTAAPGVTVTGFPTLPADVLNGGTALGMPVSHSYVGLGSMAGPPPPSYIPPQAWAAGVPGYDALQALHGLSAGTRGRPLLPGSTAAQDSGEFCAPGGEVQLPTAAVPRPVLDIAPLQTTPSSPSSLAVRPD